MSDHELTLAEYFLVIHKVISRGVDISVEQVGNFIQGGFPSEHTRAGYLNYLTALCVMFDSHHKTEDKIAFHYFRDALPDTHFDWLFEDHNLINGFLEEMTPIIESLKRREQVDNNLVLLKDVLVNISDRWYGHIGLEEEEFIELIDALSAPEEKTKLIEDFAVFNERLLKPFDLTIPFMLFNLETHDRPVIQKAYPITWITAFDTPEKKEKLESILPFLLGI